MFVTAGRSETVTNETVTAEELGGACAHDAGAGRRRLASRTRGVYFANPRLLDFLPASNESGARRPSTDDIERIEPSLDLAHPRKPKQPYTIKG